MSCCSSIPFYMLPIFVLQRCHIVDQFNTGTYDIIIASDEINAESSEQKGKKDKKSRSKSHRKDTEYGVARGIDFQCVSNVINFDFPASSQAYIHRVGRLVYLSSY